MPVGGVLLKDGIDMISALMVYGKVSACQLLCQLLLDFNRNNIGRIGFHAA